MNELDWGQLYSWPQSLTTIYKSEKMKEAHMTEENAGTQQLMALGRLEVKMDNMEKGTDKLETKIDENAKRQEAKIDEVGQRITTLEIKVNSIEQNQPAKEARVSKWQIAGTVASFILAFGTLVTLAVILIPLFSKVTP